ncbi:MAG: DNA mismatch repair endonuclease MutL [Candidatus Paraimprobicoccus trichonymphae]|uniref:DNA mismatch repair protein MutL n=1 Tax=Candidatus Paraimprobicoccus trichonymphae TaxID=3033793 RepID=A0AA48HWT9_9FIRM|nr:MAG: DNA mismatch repair endonuclease MutL [Candidatus Paraimprobicoccus trichonymphae]
MNRINILDKKIVELIAAGEIVERPASAVKELVENSIDAGANMISVHIKNGGIKFIKISDNGSGICKQDVKKAFLKNATSKVKDIYDLNFIKTLGFRGEALASISSISKLELITRIKKEDVGSRYLITGGEEEKFEDFGCPVGSVFTIKDLFFNTPARMKFLKSDVAEANAISGIIDKITLSHPEISFKYVRDDKEILNTSGDGKIFSCIYSVYGKEFSENLIPIDYELKNIKISGFISKTSYGRASKSMQHFFVNNRYVKIKIGSVALQEAFKSSMISGKFPSCVLYINLSYQAVDVNVHPSKTEVRFMDERFIFDTIYYGTKNALLKYDNQVIITSNFKEDKDKIFEKYYIPNEEFEKFEAINNFENIAKKNVEPELVQKKSDFMKNKFNYLINSMIKEEKQQTFEEKNDTLKILGEIFKCYIVLQNNPQELILVDKHAAHERLIYEKLKSNKISENSQVLLEPVMINLEKSEYSAILENLDLISKVGYKIEDFGSGNLIVRSIPVYLNTSDISNSIIEISNYILKNKNNLDINHLDWLYYSISCQGAIKSGKISNNLEILDLIKKLLNNSEIKHCPHGRNIFFSILKKDLDKKFSRK